MYRIVYYQFILITVDVFHTTQSTTDSNCFLFVFTPNQPGRLYQDEQGTECYKKAHEQESRCTEHSEHLYRITAHTQEWTDSIDKYLSPSKCEAFNYISRVGQSEENTSKQVLLKSTEKKRGKKRKEKRGK